MTITKISIKTVEKTSEYIQREMASVKAHRKKLLKDTDWTMLRDVELSQDDLDFYVKWRATVRQFKIDENNYEDVQNELKRLERKRNDYGY